MHIVSLEFEKFSRAGFHIAPPFRCLISPCLRDQILGLQRCCCGRCGPPPSVCNLFPVGVRFWSGLISLRVQVAHRVVHTSTRHTLIMFVCHSARRSFTQKYIFLDDRLGHVHMVGRINSWAVLYRFESWPCRRRQKSHL